MQEIKIYCAGPLFNEKEREEMAEIAEMIETIGLSTFLPQRDGIEMAVSATMLTKHGYSEEEANEILGKIIFSLDAYQVVNGCQATVVNLNGRVPDEGAVSEGAMAWAAGKKVFLYKADARTLLNGSDNPLVVGLADFQVSNNLQQLELSIRKWVDNYSEIRLTCHDIPALNTGRQLSEAFENSRDIIKLVRIIEGKASERSRKK